MSIASLYPSINPSLLLDFANSKVLDPRITFTRTTTATYYDGVTTAKAEENLFTYSEQIDNSDWAKSSATVTANSTTAPDGTTTADTFTEAAATGVPYFKETITTTADTITISVYAKANGRNQVCLSLYGGAANKYISAVYDLSGVSVSKTQAGSSGTISSTSITSVGNSWYRLVMTGSVTAPSTIQPYFYLTNSTTPTIDSFGTPAAYAGNGTSGMYFWGAQAEIRSSATAYTATTTQAITNYIPVLQTAAAGQARFDHNPTTGESLGLLIEEARTNLVTYSEQFDNAAWSKSQVSVYANDAVAPNGTVTADRIVESTANNVHDVTQVVSISGAVHTISCYLKCINTSRPRAALVCYDGGAGTTRINIVFDLAAGTIVQSGHGTGTITSVGNGWYRCTATSSVALVSNASVSIRNVNNSNNEIYAGDGWSGVFAWGCQFEQGSFATSYIPTVASSVTRNADAASMTGTNFSSWFNNGEGTLYGEMQRAQGAISGTNFHIATIGNSSSSGNYYKLRFEGSSTVRAGLSYTSGTEQCGFTQGTTTAGNFYKLCLGVKVNDFGFSSDNTTASTDTSGTVPIGLNQMIIGADVDGTSQIANNRIRKLAYYPIKATSAQLQALTV